MSLALISVNDPAATALKATVDIKIPDKKSKRKPSHLPPAMNKNHEPKIIQLSYILIQSRESIKIF